MQVHRSLEKISTFLEEKFIEDSDDLEQSSDKETASRSKRKAFDSTSKRPSNHRKSEQCNSAIQKPEQCSSAKKETEQSGSLFDSSVVDLLESSEVKNQRTTQPKISVFQHLFSIMMSVLVPRCQMHWPKELMRLFLRNPLRANSKR